MMKFRDEIRSFIKRVEQFILEERSSVKLLELLKEENTSLRRQNELLFEKLMAKDFEQYAIYKTEDEVAKLNDPFDPLSDDALAGDVFDETEQSANTE
jgi:hypothetical protein